MNENYRSFFIEHDYYPFGMVMPERNFSSDSYRFGFNGKEKDDEIKGSGDSYAFEFRIYDARLGKFLSVDPLKANYPHYTPYSFAGNKPIWFIDLEGLEEGLPWFLTENKYGGNPVLTLGLGPLPSVNRIDYGAIPKTAPSIFMYNSFAAAWNGVANTWNEAREGKTGSDMLNESVRGINEFTEHATTADYKNLLTDVKTYENIGGAIGTAFLTKRISGLRVFTTSGKTFMSSSIRFSQNTVNDFGQAFTDVKAGTYAPIHIVKMSDEMYTTVDNTRLLAAQHLGVDIKAITHTYDEILPGDMLDWFKNKKTGEYAKTWGEAIKFRTQNQTGKFYEKYGEGGSFIQPEIKSN